MAAIHLLPSRAAITNESMRRRRYSPVVFSSPRDALATLFALACLCMGLAHTAGTADGSSLKRHVAAHRTAKRGCHAGAARSSARQKCARSKPKRHHPKSKPPPKGGTTGSRETEAPAPGSGSGSGSGSSGESNGGGVPGGGLTGQRPLRWAPPALSSPQTVSVPSGHDPYVLNLSTTQDYIVKLPSGGLHGTLEINGGHNVVLIGGEIVVPSTANQTDNGADGSDTALYVRHSTGVVHLEGLLLRGETDVQFDGIDVNAPEAVVQVEDVRMTALYGSLTTEHADAIQTWGGAKALDIDDLSADGDYQGLTINPNEGSVASADIENVDLTVDPRPPALAEISVGGGIMLWLTSETTTCNARPVALSNVYILNNGGLVPSTETFWPSPTSGLACAGHVSGATVTWPALPVSGSVTLGAPPGGPFVPAGLAGRSYVSPGYQAP